MKEKKEVKKFKVRGGTLVFWFEGKTLFCKVKEMGTDIYCCGDKQMPETKIQALRYAETAWIW